MVQIKGGRTVWTFLILFLDGLLALLPIGFVVLVAAAFAGALVAWLVGGVALSGAKLFTGVAAVVLVVLVIRNTLAVLKKLRGPGAYLYKTKWGKAVYLNR